MPEARIRRSTGGSVTPRCPACGAPTVPWLTAAAAEIGLPDVTIARCASCGTATTLDPPPPGPDSHETGDYATAAPRGVRLAAALLWLFDRQRLRLTRRALPPPARLVDAGAGRGRFVAHARAAGYSDAIGVEPTARGVQQARLRHGLTLEQATIQDAGIAAAAADVVTVWHVLEHVENPAATLDVLHGWLRPGGVLVVGVPNLDSWQARVGGRHWFHLDLPRHRTHFTARGLTRLLTDHGFDVIRTTHILGEHNPYGMWQSAVSRGTARPSYLFHLLKRNAELDPRDLAVTALGLVLLPVAVAAELAAGLCRRGGTVAVVARRRA